jgi:cation diffusion facilitator family transporter
MEACVTRDLTRYAWLSIAAGVATLGLKTLAWWLTGSVGLLSDAIESIVNVVAAAVALWALSVAAAPPDEEHEHGHGKVEYFSSGFEGGLIIVAAIAIVVSAVPRLLAPRPLEHVGVGLAVSAGASVVNFVVGGLLIRTGKKHGSITLEADGHHLMTDVWTSVGVIVGVTLARLTGWYWIDPLLAIFVALQILRTGYKLVRRSGMGLLDAAVSKEERAAIEAVLDSYHAEGAHWHALRTRQAGQRCFASVHVLVPGSWTVARGHDLLERLEADLHKAVPTMVVLTHLEPIEDERAYGDAGL